VMLVALVAPMLPMVLLASAILAAGAEIVTPACGTY